MPPKKNTYVMKAYEKVDVITLRKLMNAKEFDNNTRNQLQNYYKLKSNDGYFPVTYSYSKNLGNKGRLYADGSLSLQNFKKNIRCTLAKDYYFDIDMCNAHPVLLSQYCAKNGIACSKIKTYVAKRDKILGMIQYRHNISYKEAKKLILRLCYGGAYVIDINGNEVIPTNKIQFLNEFQQELKIIMVNVCRLEKEIYEDVCKNNKSNKNASVMSILAQTLEHECLMSMYNFFEIKKENVGVLCFDGLMVEKSDTLTENTISDILVSCEKYVFSKTGYNITLDVKPLDVELGFDLPKLYMLVESDGECRDQLLVIEGKNKFVYCEDVLYIYDERFGLFSSNIHTLFYYLEKNKDFLQTQGGLSYGTSSRLQRDVVQAVKNACVDNTWLERTANSSLGKLLFQDGIYDIQKGVFTKGFDPNIVFHCNINRPFPVRNEEYVKYAKSLSFDSLFEKDNAIQMQVFLARALAGDHMKKFFFCPGESNSGKSSFTKMLNIAFESYVGSFNVSRMAHTKYDNNDEGAQNRWSYLLRWSRILCSNEANMKKPLDSKMIKEHSGGDKLTGRFHHGDETEYTPHYTIFCMLNDIPKIDPLDDATLKRLTYIKFPNVFGSAERPSIDNFDSIIRSEKFMSGFVHAVLEGYQIYLRGDMPKLSESVKEEWTENVKQTDLLKDTLLDNYKITSLKTDFVTVADLKQFRNNHREIYSTISDRNFNAFLKSLGLTYGKKSDKRGWEGLAVIPITTNSTNNMLSSLSSHS